MDINQTAVLSFARRIVQSGYPYSVLEIDDRWSSAYGDFTFDADKFPDPQQMIRELHGLNFSVMLWVIPFCDFHANAYLEGLRRGAWVLKGNGKGRGGDAAPVQAYPVRWWQNNSTGSAVLDVTNPDAVEWFIQRLKELKRVLGIDGFKLDAGEVAYIPPLADPAAIYFNRELFRNDSQPLEYTRLYASIANQLESGFTEVRAAWRTQQHRNYVRIMDLDSVWGANNGIGSVIPRVILFSTLGYRFVLPDMIGGNGYGARGDLLFRGTPTAELYIRWIQCNALLPMQLSIPPWRYTTDPLYESILKVVEGVFTLRHLLMPLYRRAVADAVGDTDRFRFRFLPLARPMWFAEPLDPASWSREDQYMLGDAVVLAPILERNTSSRAVYLPSGSWISCLSADPDTDPESWNFNNESSIPWNLLHFVSTEAKPAILKVTGPITFQLTGVALTSSTPCFKKLQKYA